MKLPSHIKNIGSMELSFFRCLAVMPPSFYLGRCSGMSYWEGISVKLLGMLVKLSTFGLLLFPYSDQNKAIIHLVQQEALILEVIQSKAENQTYFHKEEINFGFDQYFILHSNYSLNAGDKTEVCSVTLAAYCSHGHFRHEPVWGCLQL